MSRGQPSGARPPRVRRVEHLGGRTLRVGFSDGLVRELDFAGKLPGVLGMVDDDDVFAQASVDSVAGTVCWPVGIDLDPDVLHGDARCATPPRARVPASAGRLTTPALGVAQRRQSVWVASCHHRSRCRRSRSRPAAAARSATSASPNNARAWSI